MRLSTARDPDELCRARQVGNLDHDSGRMQREIEQANLESEKPVAK